MNLIVRDMETPEHCTTPQDEVPQSLAFTVTFSEARKKPFQRHSRNLSLPVVKVYDNNVVPTSINGANKAGNRSEGYFSSDPEDENRQLKDSSSGPTFPSPCDELSETNRITPSDPAEEESDALSETGTYTIDTETPEVMTARLSIDASFGVDPTIKTTRDSSEWISEWASTALTHQKTSRLPNTGSQTSLLGASTAKTNMTITKIPSPILSTRERLGVRKTKKGDRESLNDTTLLSESAGSSYDTESYLKTTEKALSVIAARMSVSLDSGGESDADSKSSGNKKNLPRSDSSASESGPKPQTSSSSRYNRAFSLRRGRLDVDEQPKTVEKSLGSRNSSRGITPMTEIPPSQPRSASSVRSKATTPILPPPTAGLSRNDNARLSIRSKLSPQSPLLSQPKNGMVGANKKPNPNPQNGNSRGRSNSSLSSKAVEFQNWKRRKNYDPIKAAAQGKKKEAASKKPIGVGPGVVGGAATSSVIKQGIAPAAGVPSNSRSPATSVLRSASFHGHGTKQSLAIGPSSSEEEEEEEEEEAAPEEEEITLSAEDGEWTNPPQVPKTSLENTPRSSRVSLYSNNSNSPRARHKLEGVDNLVVSAISGISNKLRINASGLLKKLRYLYDEESEKYKSLSDELEQLERLGETSASPQKSSSRELALTLKNLKHLDSTLKVLNDVLFDNVDYE